jgi:hypothetical protein
MDSKSCCLFWEYRHQFSAGLFEVVYGIPQPRQSNAQKQSLSQIITIASAHIITIIQLPIIIPCSGRLLPPGSFLVLISVTVDPRAMLCLQELGQIKIE